MEKRILGKTGLEVTELCFGALPMGPAQKNQSVEENSQIIAYALRKGINFIDTAQMYKTYEPICNAIKETGLRPIIASKSNKKSYEEMKEAVYEAIDKLGIDYVDIFHLHAAREGDNAFELFADALHCLEDLKEKGIIKAIGISTHSSAVTALAAEKAEIDVVFPIINITGRGIIDGTREDMEKAISKVANSGKGLYLMKVLAGGGLLNKYTEAMSYAQCIKGSSSIAIGMTSISEVNYNLNFFNNNTAGEISETCFNKKALVFRAICKSCGKCIAACPNNAISFDYEKKAIINKSACITCGYCTPVCPEFAIRVV